MSTIEAALSHEDPAVRTHAAAVAEALGPEALPLVPALLRRACVDRVPDVRYAMLRALDRIEPSAEDSVAVFLDLLRTLPKDEPDDPHGFARSLAAWGIGRMGPDAAAGEGVATLVRIAGDPDDHGDPRYAAGWSLARLAPASAPALPTLQTILRGDHDGSMRSIAAEAIGALGADAEEAVPDLVAALEDEAELVREDAARALGRVARGADSAVPALVRALDDPNALVREYAVESLGRFGADAAPAAGAVVDALRSDTAVVRRKAALALGAIGLGPEAAAALSERAVRDDDPLVRDAARRSLADAGETVAEFVDPATYEELQVRRRHEDGRIRAGTTWRLASWGPAIAELAPSLVRQLLEDDHSDARWAAAWALGRLRSATPDVVAGLAEAAVSDRDPDNRAEAVRALGWLGPGAAAAQPRLEQALRDGYSLVREEAAVALERIGGGVEVPA